MEDEWEKKERSVENLQEGLSILGVTKGEIMMSWAVMDIQESYTASKDVPQSSAAPLCPQDSIPDDFVKNKNWSLVAVRWITCTGPEGDKRPQKIQIHTSTLKKNQNKDLEASSREWGVRIQKKDDAQLTLSHCMSWGHVSTSRSRDRAGQSVTCQENWDCPSCCAAQSWTCWMSSGRSYDPHKCIGLCTKETQIFK